MTTRDITDEGYRGLSRRRLLGGLALAGVAGLAGCGSSNEGNGDDPDGGPSGDAGNGGSNGDAGRNSGGSGDNGDGTGGQGDTGGKEQLSGVIGEQLRGERAAFAVEYVRPVEEIRDFMEFPDTDSDIPYGATKTIDDFAGRGLAKSGESFYAVGIAVKNTIETPIDSQTLVLRGEDTIEMGLFPSETQRLTAGSSARTSGNAVAPGELLRAELVFALADDPSSYTLSFQPYEVSSGSIETYTVDLGAGTEATATLTQDVPLQALETPVVVGDFSVTLHGVERVASLSESPYQELFGPRPGFEYLEFELSAERTGDVMIGQDWSLGVLDDEGYGFSWMRIYQDAYELNRTRLEELSVGERVDHTRLAFPIESDFQPTAVTMTGPGKLENPPQFGSDQTIDRVAWPLQ